MTPLDRARQRLADLERQAIVRALRASRGSVWAAARTLGLSYRTMWRRVRLYGLTALIRGLRDDHRDRANRGAVPRDGYAATHGVTSPKDGGK